MPISDQHNAKIIKVTFKFPEFLSTHQKSAYSTDSFLTYSQFQCPETRVATPIFDHTHANIFQSTFNFYESALICKKSGFFIILFQRCRQFKKLKSDWLRAFWLISQEPDISQVWVLCKNTANIIKFLYSPNSEKINYSIFQ